MAWQVVRDEDVCRQALDVLAGYDFRWFVHRESYPLRRAPELCIEIDGTLDARRAARDMLLRSPLVGEITTHDNSKRTTIILEVQGATNAPQVRSVLTRVLGRGPR